MARMGLENSERTFDSCQFLSCSRMSILACTLDPTAASSVASRKFLPASKCLHASAGWFPAKQAIAFSSCVLASAIDDSVQCSTSVSQNDESSVPLALSNKTLAK